MLFNLYNFNNTLFIDIFPYKNNIETKLEYNLKMRKRNLIINIDRYSFGRWGEGRQ